MFSSTPGLASEIKINIQQTINKVFLQLLLNDICCLYKYLIQKLNLFQKLKMAHHFQEPNTQSCEKGLLKLVLVCQSLQVHSNNFIYDYSTFSSTLIVEKNKQICSLGTTTGKFISLACQGHTDYCSQLCLKLSTEVDMQAFRGSRQHPVEFHAHTSAQRALDVLCTHMGRLAHLRA